MSQERYGLGWIGRAEAMQAALLRAPRDALTPLPHLSRGFEDAPHAVIEGDNLEVSRILAPAYDGSVQLVFLDPPYNTGRDLLYEDRFGADHDRWLTMMYPRLVAAHRLLRDEGFCVVTIDDGEVAQLRLLLDEVFGPRSFVANVVWEKAYVANQTARHLSNTHDHILVYAKDPAAARTGRLPRSVRQLGAFQNPDDDPRGPWKAENLSAGKPYSKGSFTIVTPTGRQVRPPPGRWWRCSQARYEAWLADGRIWFGRDGRGRPMLKKFLSEVRPGLTPSTWWPHEECGTNKEASLELKRLFDGQAVFETPKPVRLLKRIVSLFCPDGGTVFDLFAGSGTTGQAVMELHQEDKKLRPSVLVQLPEPTGRPELPDLAAVCRERLRRAGTLLGAPGFRAFRQVSIEQADPRWVEALSRGVPLHGDPDAPGARSTPSAGLTEPG